MRHHFQWPIARSLCLQEMLPMPDRFMLRSLRVCLVFAALYCVPQIHAAQVPQGPAKEVPELQILSCYAGTWKATSKWILDGRFLEQTGILQASAGGNPIKITTLMTYDADKKIFRTWTFVSDGQATESEGKWDPATQTMTSVDLPGVKHQVVTTTVNFSEAGIQKWKMVIADQSGKILSQMVGKNVRQRE
jgi:hypothetical protein